MTVYLLAHGSADPRHAQDVSQIAARLSQRLAEPVRACYLDLCPPSLPDIADTGGTVVPLLFSPGYHATVDVAEAVADARVPLAVADPPLLTSGARWGRHLVAESVREWPGRRPVLVTAGTRDRRVLQLWEETASALSVPVVHASGPGTPLVGSGPPAAGSVVVPVLAARGFFSDRIAAQAASLDVPVAPLAGASRAVVAEMAASVRRSRQAGAPAAHTPAGAPAATIVGLADTPQSGRTGPANWAPA